MIRGDSRVIIRHLVHQAMLVREEPPVICANAVIGRERDYSTVNEIFCEVLAPRFRSVAETWRTYDPGGSWASAISDQ